MGFGVWGLGFGVWGLGLLTLHFISILIRHSISIEAKNFIKSISGEFFIDYHRIYDVSLETL